MLFLGHIITWLKLFLLPFPIFIIFPLRFYVAFSKTVTDRHPNFGLSLNSWRAPLICYVCCTFSLVLIFFPLCFSRHQFYTYFYFLRTCIVICNSAIVTLNDMVIQISNWNRSRIQNLPRTVLLIIECEVANFYAWKQLLLSARLSHRNSVRPSVRPSVSHTGGSVKNGAS